MNAARTLCIAAATATATSSTRRWSRTMTTSTDANFTLRELKRERQCAYANVTLTRNPQQQQQQRRRRRRRRKRRVDRTVKAESETRLASILTSLPQRLDLYFQRRSYRMFLWKSIFVFVGFYLASVLTLSFGALAINDVVAGALCVFIYEVITRWYYKTKQLGRKLEFLNCFKLGLAYSLIADAFKLGS